MTKRTVLLREHSRSGRVIFAMAKRSTSTTSATSKPAAANRQSSAGSERRSYERYATSLSVDYQHGDTFLYSYVTNISEMGIFIASQKPLPVGTHLSLRFGNNGGAALELDGEVAWINPVLESGDNINPGMGVRFTNLTPELRERVVELVHTVAYLNEP